VYRDEEQRFIVFTIILLSYLIDCRIVSLFDIRIKIDDNFIIIKRNKEIFDGDENIMIDELKNNIILNTDEKSDDGKFRRKKSDFSKDRPRRVRKEVGENAKNKIDDGTNYSIFSDIKRNAESDTDYSIFNKDDDFDYFSDNFNIIDNKYNVDFEKIESII
jgi:hypothetical protein